MFACGDGILLGSWLREDREKVDFAAEGANRARNEVAPPLTLGQRRRWWDRRTSNERHTEMTEVTKAEKRMSAGMEAFLT